MGNYDFVSNEIDVKNEEDIFDVSLANKTLNELNEDEKGEELFVSFRSASSHMKCLKFNSHCFFCSLFWSSYQKIYRLPRVDKSLSTHVKHKLPPNPLLLGTKL